MNHDLKKMCYKDHIDYNSIKKRIRYMNTKEEYKNVSFDEKYLLSKTKYLDKRDKDTLKMRYKLLDKATTYYDYKYICLSLNINFKTVKRLDKLINDTKSVILIIWYFGNINTKNSISITNKQFYKVFNEESLSDKIYQFIGYYKCGKKKYLEDIINYENKYIKSNCYKVLKKFNIIPIKDKIDDLLSYSNLVLINILNNIVLNDIKRIIKYIHTVLYYRIFDYVKLNYIKCLQFNDNIEGSLLYGKREYYF